MLTYTRIVKQRYSVQMKKVLEQTRAGDGIDLAVCYLLLEPGADLSVHLPLNDSSSCARATRRDPIAGAQHGIACTQ